MYSYLGQSSDLEKRILIILKTLARKPMIKGTRLAVEYIIDLLDHDRSESEILENYLALHMKIFRSG